MMVSTALVDSPLRVRLAFIVPLLLSLYIVLLVLNPAADSRAEVSKPKTDTLRWESFLETVPDFHTEESGLVWEGKRDVCSDAIPGSTDGQCTPGNTTHITLCCLDPSSDYPMCEILLGVGFCVVSSSGNSYTDTNSVCASPNAVQCPISLSAAGAGTVCCPQFTTCSSEGNFTQDYVRCEGNASVLANIYPSTTTSLVSSTSLSSTLASHSTLATTTSQSSLSGAITSAKTSQTSLLSTTTSIPHTPSTIPKAGLSSGAIAAIAIGAVLAVILAALAGWWCIRRRKKNRKAANPSAESVSGYKHEMDGMGAQKRQTQPLKMQPPWIDGGEMPANDKRWYAEEHLPGPNQRLVQEVE